jgi:hypothetical protein
MRRRQLPNLAIANGWTVLEFQGKYEFHKKDVIIVMYENGNLVRGDVDLSLSTSMSVKDVVSMMISK